MSKFNDSKINHGSGAETPGKERTKTRWVRPMAVIALVFLFALIAVSAGSQDALAAGPPTVNGLFYGDGDDQVYWPYGYSEHGSILYVYYDHPTLYAALVVNRTVNDNVCSTEVLYPQDAGWPNSRNCKRMTDSEYASFNLRCTETPNSWTWRQGYAGEVEGTWISGTTVSGGLGTGPPGYVAGSSFAWNVNTYQDKAYPGSVPWDLYNGNSPISTVIDWKSPFESGSPDTVVGLDGYPADDPLNPGSIPIVFSTVYEWEWPMVYEWSADLTECGANPVFLVAGESHHSPIKQGDEDDSYDPFFDLGDLPDTYSTLIASGGPRHEFVLSNNVFMGLSRDNEADGQPEPDATGDDVNDGNDDEDGVTLGNQSWTNGKTVDINISLLGAAATADIGMWIDWGNDGSFHCPSDFYAFTDLTVGTTNTVQVTIPDSGTYTVGDPVHMRVRAFDDETNAPGGSLECTDFGGDVENGEVEDYLWLFTPTAISLTTISADPSTRIYPLIWVGLLLLLAVTVLVVLRRNQRKHADVLAGPEDEI